MKAHNKNRRGNYKLYPTEVRLIRQLRKMGSTTVKLAQIFNCTPSNITRICNRERWAGV